MTTADRLLAIYNRMLAQLGPQHWWPAETPLEMIVGAILTQSAAWTNVEKAIHNLKYYTWVEQQGKEVEDLNQLWYDRELWNKMFLQVERWDELINQFNERTGVLKKL